MRVSKGTTAEEVERVTKELKEFVFAKCKHCDISGTLSSESLIRCKDCGKPYRTCKHCGKLNCACG